MVSGPMHPHNLSSHLEGPVQTNNRAELTACVEELRAIPLSQPRRVITNGKHVYDGVTAYMHRWAVQGRQVSNHDLWDSLRSLMRSPSGKTLWKHVYSHVGVVDNERADTLANFGRLQHPGRPQFVRDLRGRLKRSVRAVRA